MPADPLDWLAYLAALINLVAGGGAVVAALRRQIQPNPVSWAVWSATGWIAFAGQVQQGVGAPALLTLTVGIVATAILLACFVEIGSPEHRFQVNLHPSWQVTPLDAACGVLALLTLVAWQVTASATVAIALSIAVDALAGIPTIAKAYRSPRTEPAVLYLAAIVCGVLTLASVTSWTFGDAGFAVYFLLLNITIAVPVTVDRLRTRAVPRWALATPFAVAGAVAGAVLVPVLLGAGMAAAATPVVVAGRPSPTVEDGRWRSVSLPPAVQPGPAVQAGPVAQLVAAAAVPTWHEQLPMAAPASSLALDPAGRLGYVAHGDTPDPATGRPFLSVLDTTTNRIVGRIPSPAGPPRAVSFCPGSGRAFVTVSAGPAAAFIGVLDMATSTWVAQIPVGRGPMASACTPDARRLYVTSYDEAQVDVIDVATARHVGAVPVPPHPVAVVFDRGGSRAWTVHQAPGRIVLLDVASSRVIGPTATLGAGPRGIAVNAAGTRAAVTNVADGTVTILDLAGNGTAVASIPLAPGSSPRDVAYSADGTMLYTANTRAGTVSAVRVDTGAVTATIAVEGGPAGIAASADGRRLYVVLDATGGIAVLTP
jgi:YVTN family beta-propeller protein